MTKLEPNLAASLLRAREASATITVPMVESATEASAGEDIEDEGDGAWVDEVTTNVAALWAGRRANVSFESAMASVESRSRRRRL
ncbi:MAG: hypothetical protein U0359_28800 [Byssovorax sp.]